MIQLLVELSNLRLLMASGCLSRHLITYHYHRRRLSVHERPV